jgi:hypothetical protein
MRKYRNISGLDRLAINWQCMLLAQDVSGFLKEIVNYDIRRDGVYEICDVDLDPLRKRLFAIKKLHSDKEGNNGSSNRE